MKKAFYLIIAIVSIGFFQSCEEADLDTDLNYVTFSDSQVMAPVNIGSSATVDVTVFTSNVTGSDRTFAIEVIDGATSADAQTYTVPASVTIPANTNMGTFTVNINDVNISEDGETLTLGIVQDGTIDTGGNITLDIEQQCPVDPLMIDFIFDGFGSEISWQVTRDDDDDDSDDEVLFSSAQGNYADGQTTASESLCLQESGDFTFTVFDSFGDGLSYPASGSVTVSRAGTVFGSAEGDFGSEASIQFSL